MWGRTPSSVQRSVASAPRVRARPAGITSLLLTAANPDGIMALYDMSLKDIMESLPLTEPVLLILLSLAGQPQHGYSILKDVERMSNGRVVLSTGTLYGALRRLLDDDWIERFEEEESSRGRQAYRLTPQGRRNLQMEIDRMKHITKLATLRVAKEN